MTASDIPAIARGMFKRYKKGIIIFAIAAIILIAGYKFLTRDRNNENAADYKTINDIPGISFEIKRDFLNVSTTISNIEESVTDLLDNQSYIYRNGEDTYIIFNMRRYLGIVKKGVDFDLRTNPTDMVIDDIWFSKQNIKDKPKTRKGISSINTIASVSFSASMYNDFYGTLTTLSDGNDTYAFFFGVPKKNYEDNADVIEYTVATIKQNSTNIINKEIEETILTSEDTAVADIGETPTEDETEVTEPVDDDPIDDDGDISGGDSSSDNGSADTEPIDEKEDPVDDFDETDTSSDNTEDGNSTTDSDTTVVADTGNEETEQSEETVVTVEPIVTKVVRETPSDRVFEIYDKELIEQKDTTSAKSSTPYTMLRPGETGSLQVFSEYTSEVESAYVRIQAFYDAEEVDEILADYIDSNIPYYDEFKPSSGCHLEAVRYDVRYTSASKPSMDITITGLNGENLIFRGNIYGTRTYGIKYLGGEEQNDWYMGYMVFYEVPNGCVDYALKFGGYSTNRETGAAWFKVER